MRETLSNPSDYVRAYIRIEFLVMSMAIVVNKLIILQLI